MTQAYKVTFTLNGVRQVRTVYSDSASSVRKTIARAYPGSTKIVAQRAPELDL
jgi:ribosomal protein L34E